MKFMPIEDLKILGYDVEVHHSRMIDAYGCPMPKGGTTVVHVFEPDGRPAAMGIANCSSEDNFNRKLGVRIALGRALKSMEAPESDPIDLVDIWAKNLLPMIGAKLAD